MRRLALLTTFALVASLILVPAALAQEEVPEILEEQAEDPQEPLEENVAEGQREAALEEQVEAQQGRDLTPAQEAALEPQAELEAAPALPKAEPKMMEEKGKEKMKETPKTGGPALGSLLLPVGALLLSSGVMVFAVVRRRR
jgi:hypothetical protein